MSHIIREYTHEDNKSVQQCLVELQNFHSIIDSHRLENVLIANEYLKHLLEKCERNHGKIFVVEIEGSVVGMISIVIQTDTASIRKIKRHAFISDLIILLEYRNRGISKELLKKAEEYAKTKDVSVVETAVLIRNDKALRMYLRNGFHESELILRKKV